MSVSLKDIIQECYLKVRNSELNSLFHSNYQIAGLILGEMYNIYENSKEKELYVELKFFIDTKNVIKHLINILNNSGDSGTMTVGNAILQEYKLIESEKDTNNVSTPLTIIQNALKVVNQSEIRNPEYKHAIIERIINNMIEDRMSGILNEDGKEILRQDSVFELIEMIIDRVILGEEIRISINEVFLLIEEGKKRQENSYEIMKKEILNEFKVLLSEIHEHIDHVGKSTFAAITANTPDQIQSSPHHKHGRRIPSLFGDS